LRFETMTDRVEHAKKQQEHEEVEIPSLSKLGLTPDEALHPLQYRWTLWFNPPARGSDKANWTSNNRPVATFGTVEDFWRLYNNLVLPSQLQLGSNYHLFKDGVQPEWEDAENSKGGKWVMNFNRRTEAEIQEFDDAWTWTLLALIGEFFEDSDHICGVVISPRAKQNRLALWTKDAQNSAVVKRIGATFKRNINEAMSIGYQVHADAVKQGSTFRTANLYTL